MIANRPMQGNSEVAGNTVSGRCRSGYIRGRIWSAGDRTGMALVSDRI